MRSRIGVIDHGAGNLVSITNALAAIGADVDVVRAPSALDRFGGLVLPGVGSTGPAMDCLATTGMDRAIAAWQRPLLGICVGYQLLFDRSDEDGRSCLGLIGGTVERVTGTPLPHMGWNSVDHTGDPAFAGIPSGEPFYFVHSYAPVPSDPDIVIASSTHGRSFAAAVRDGVRLGTQFHPERSGVAGARFLANFVASIVEVEHAA